MGKYEAIELLWSKSKNKYIYPGETLELDDEIAKIMLGKKLVKPARYKPDLVGKSRKSKTHRVGKLDKEKGNVSNN